MSNRVSNHEKGNHQEHGTTILQFQRAPVQCETEDNVGKANITDQVTVRLARRQHIRGNIDKPIERLRDHPDAVDKHDHTNDM